MRREILLVGTDVDLHERLTMRGVFLHVLGDTMSSINVVASALLIKFIDDDAGWKYRIDPLARQPDILTVTSAIFFLKN